MVSPEQQQLLDRGSKKSEQLLKKLSKEIEDGLRIATDRKNKLLVFQATSEKRMVSSAPRRGLRCRSW